MSGMYCQKLFGDELGPVDFSGKENYAKYGKWTEEDVYNQKADLGCVICWKTMTTNWGKEMGIKLKCCSVCNGPRLYCSKRCFKKDWNKYNHQAECKRLAAEVEIDDLDAEAAKAQALKKQANELFKAKKYQEAIALYTDVKIAAIQIRRAARKSRLKQFKEEAENLKLPEYLKIKTKKDDDEEEDEEEVLVSEHDLKMCSRPHPLEKDMSRLSAIAANNTAITYIKLGDGIRASGAAREAMKLDPLFSYRILPQLIASMRLLVHSDECRGAKEFLEMANRVAHMEYINEKKDDSITMSCCTVLFNLRLISYRSFARKSNQFLYELIDKDKKLIEAATGGPEDFMCRAFSALFIGKEGINVTAAIIPFREAHWITIGHNNNGGIFGYVNPEYRSLRVRPVDLRGNADDVDYSVGHPQGSISHVASLTGLKNAHREIILYVNDLEREGLKVSTVTLGCGLFHLLPKDQDPQKSQRKHNKWKVDKYVLYPGHYIPPHTKVYPAFNHIRPENQQAWRERIAKELAKS